LGTWPQPTAPKDQLIPSASIASPASAYP